MRGIIRSRAGELQSRTKPRRAARLRTIRIMSCAPAGESAALRSAQLTGVRSAVGNGVLPQPRRSPHPCGSRCRSAAVVQPSANPTGAVGPCGLRLKASPRPRPNPAALVVRGSQSLRSLLVPVLAISAPCGPRRTGKLCSVHGLSIKTGQAGKGG